MAFAVATQILVDGPRNTVAKTTGDFVMTTLPTAVTILDPATLTKMLPGMSGGGPGPQLLRIDHIEYSISDGLTVQLYWDATTPVAICELYGRGKVEAKRFGGLVNNAGAGVTGKILLTVILADQTATTPTGSIFFTTQTAKYLFNGVQGA